MIRQRRLFDSIYEIRFDEKHQEQMDYLLDSKPTIEEFENYCDAWNIEFSITDINRKSEPMFFSVNNINYKRFGMSKDRYNELIDRNEIMLGTFIDGLPIVFHTKYSDETLQNYINECKSQYFELKNALESQW